MFYRESGDFKTTYGSDQQAFPIALDRWFMAVLLVFLYLVLPSIGDDYFFQEVMIPVLVYSVAAIGLNLLTGYCGLLSLGTGGFMAVGAVACFKLTTAFPEMNIILVFVLSGFVSLKQATAPTAMNPPVPSESSPQ